MDWVKGFLQRNGNVGLLYRRSNPLTQQEVDAAPSSFEQWLSGQPPEVVEEALGPEKAAIFLRQRDAADKPRQQNH